ncbi:hypothetical protein FDI61_gp101 [Mycobacterium phage Marvin]|uniref:Uncharacterized protein n=1 Tax=Mycobacterium phage Marvin TaxID=1034139 RepID=G1BNH1_9CAUD|nr:hypothetical protein FDI61_gp101 [Mycobacterium phage Marvin]AEJ95382.1 hypothetical protein MARVIN_101 [Mycobacterium phage Marvin]
MLSEKTDRHAPLDERWQALRVEMNEAFVHEMWSINRALQGLTFTRPPRFTEE